METVLARPDDSMDAHRHQYYSCVAKTIQDVDLGSWTSYTCANSYPRPRQDVPENWELSYPAFEDVVPMTGHTRDRPYTETCTLLQYYSYYIFKFF